MRNGPFWGKGRLAREGLCPSAFNRLAANYWGSLVDNQRGASAGRRLQESLYAQPSEELFLAVKLELFRLVRFGFMRVDTLFKLIKELAPS